MSRRRESEDPLRRRRGTPGGPVRSTGATPDAHAENAKASDPDSGAPRLEPSPVENGSAAADGANPNQLDQGDLDRDGLGKALAGFPLDDAPATELEHPAEAAASRLRLEAVRAPCQQLLDGCLKRLGSRSGVYYGVDGPRRLRVLGCTGIARAERLCDTERAAMSAIEARRPLLTGAGTDGDAGALPSPEGAQMLVVPCSVQGETTAVLVVERTRTARHAVDEDLARLGETLVFALAADRARIQATLEMRMSEADAVRRQLEAYAVDLRSVYLSERSRSDELSRALLELEETYEATVRGLAVAVEAKDEYTGGHLFRVSRYGMMMTAIVAPGHSDDPQFEYGFLLHDVGKLAVPDAVLVKSGALTEEEWEQIRAHPACGRNILEKIPFLAGASEIVYCHHERWDGTGFPRGLAGEDIPLGARIFPIADAFDAMTTSRPYRKALMMAEARDELVRGSGSQFWPDAVEAFMSIAPGELEEIRRGTLGASGW